MSSYSKLKSHPNKYLEVHLKNVASISQSIFDGLCIKDKSLYTNLSFFIGICHDFAKSTTFFQDKLLNDVNNDAKTKKAHHSFLSAVFAYFVVKNYLENNEINNSIDFASISFIVILKHHGNLQSIDGKKGVIINIKGNNKIAKQQIENIQNNLINYPDYSLNKFYEEYGISISDFFASYDDLIEEIEESISDLSYDEAIENYFYILLFYSVLLDADKMDASETNTFDRECIPSNLVDDFKEKKFGVEVNAINKLREEAYQEVLRNILKYDFKNKIFSIDLPTGTGKTLIAFSLALKLKEKINDALSFNPRIIYCLPFLSIIDQNEKVFSEILNDECLNKSNIILKHSHLSDMSYKVDAKDELPIDKSRILVEGWNSEIIVTTFVQFFHSLISNRNRSIRKFHNMCNSIIILDEIQAVPYQYWHIINVMLTKLSNEFNTWIILMTATQPLIFSQDQIIPLVENKELYYDNFNRIDYSFNLNDLYFDDFKELIIDEIEKNPSKDILIVLNTIKSSKELYEHVKCYFTRQFDEIFVDEDGIVVVDDCVQLTYLSTNIIPKHRLNRINKIKNKDNKRNIIVSTQLIEAGVDISVDIIYRDLAPLDSIIQTAGRCNRNSDGERGIVNVVSIVNEKGRRFSSFVYDSILISSTMDVLSDQTFVAENEFNMNSSFDYYKNLLKYGSSTQSEQLLKIIKQLDFGKIFENFKLIGNDIEKTDIFVEVDDYSSNLWGEFKENRLIKDPIERKNHFLSFKSDFYEYIVSVPNSKLGTIILENQWLGFVPNNDIYRKYDLERGFEYIEDEGSFFI